MYEAQIAAEYDKDAPRCPKCKCTMFFGVKLGVVIVWDCECGNQVEESLGDFNKRIGWVK